LFYNFQEKANELKKEMQQRLNELKKERAERQAEKRRRIMHVVNDSYNAYINRDKPRKDIKVVH
jgi:ABC-type hemin transport system substrate-binding protein